MGRGRWRGGQREGGDGEGRWRWGKFEGGDREVVKGEGQKKGQEEGDFTYEMLGWTYGMPGWNEVTDFLTLFTRATPGTPASLTMFFFLLFIFSRFFSLWYLFVFFFTLFFHIIFFTWLSRCRLEEVIVCNQFSLVVFIYYITVACLAKTNPLSFLVVSMLGYFALFNHFFSSLFR